MIRRKYEEIMDSNELPHQPFYMNSKQQQRAIPNPNPSISLNKLHSSVPYITTAIDVSIDEPVAEIHQRALDAQEVICLLESELYLYKGRASFVQGELENLLSLGLLSKYRAYQMEYRRYDKLSQDTEKEINKLKNLVNSLQSSS